MFLHRFIHLSQSSVVVCDLRIVFLNRFLLSESDVRFVGFEICFMQSFINRKSSFDVKR